MEVNEVVKLLRHQDRALNSVHRNQQVPLGSPLIQCGGKAHVEADPRRACHCQILVEGKRLVPADNGIGIFQNRIIQAGAAK